METDRLTAYYVNGDKQETTDRELTVRQVLERAGFRPPEQYRLTRDEGNQTYPSLETELKIHPNERFTALFEGPTPVS